MEKKNHSVKQLKQRKFFLILPLLTVPFLTLMFWALGGGKGNEAKGQANLQTGINLKLPDAKFKDDRHFNKLSFYEQAALDSAKTKQAENLDPYWSKSFRHFTDSSTNEESYSLKNGVRPLTTDYGMDANKMKVYNKLDELNKALNSSQTASAYNRQNSNHQLSIQPYPSSSNDLARLQAMMQKMKEEKSEDPEITQLNSMLDKIMAIQNPDQVANNNNNLKTTKSIPVKRTKQNASVSLLKPDATKIVLDDTSVETVTTNGFYSDGRFNNDDSINDNATEAVIPETQTVVAGATVKLVLSNEVTINETTLPSGTLVYGTASLSNERLKIAINSIRFQNSILPVSLDVYDMDGQEGIYVPGSINRTVAKESANNAMSGIGTTIIDPSLSAQAANAGIAAAKTLMTKKVKLIKMTIRAGYKVLLKDNHDK